MNSDSEATDGFPNNPDFEFIEQIGKGGYGKVYLARDLLMDNNVSGLTPEEKENSRCQSYFDA